MSQKRDIKRYQTRPTFKTVGVIIMENLEKAQQIAKLNDEFRSLITSREHERLEMVVFTSGVIYLQPEVQTKLLEMFRDHKNFKDEKDFYQEHDFESITLVSNKNFLEN